VSRQAGPKEYASAIYDLAFESWTQQLGAVQQAIAADAGLRDVLNDLGKPASTRLQLLSQAVPGGLAEPVRKFLGTLLEAGQIGQLDEIAAEFGRLVRHGPQRQSAEVTSAVPLTGAEEQALRNKLAARFGSELEVKFRVDPALLGGILLRVGDQVIDGSVAGKLAALRNRLTA